MSSPKHVVADPFVHFTVFRPDGKVEDAAYPRSVIKYFVDDPSGACCVVYLKGGGFFATPESFNSILRRINE